MGARFSRRKRPEKAKRLRQFGKVNDYILEPTRKRPRTSKSLRDARFIASLGQQGRSATMFEFGEEKNKLDINQPIPRWQSKWEIDMRPDPHNENISPLRPWKSMPLPTTDILSSANKTTPSNRPSLSRKSKKRTGTGRPRDRRGGRTSFGSLPVIEEPDKFDIGSVASYQIDGFKMLHKTDDRTDSALDLTAKLWNIEPKKHNKAWFMDTHHKIPEPALSFENMPRQSKPYTSYVNVVRPVGKPLITRPESTLVKHETIIEEE